DRASAPPLSRIVPRRMAARRPPLRGHPRRHRGAPRADPRTTPGERRPCPLLARDGARLSAGGRGAPLRPRHPPAGGAAMKPASGTVGVARRGLMLRGLRAGVGGALAWRIRARQVVQNEHYRMLAEENRISIRLIPPARGLITDRNGIVLAENRQNYRVVMI